jgi:hypothetical protein
MDSTEGVPCFNAVKDDDVKRHHHTSEKLVVSNILSQTTPEDAPSLLCLPDDLLVHIAKSVDGKERAKTLLNLSVVNRRLGGISRDELYATPVITLDTTRRLLSRLFEEPKLAKRIFGLEIVDDEYQYLKEAPKFPSAFLPKLREVLCVQDVNVDSLNTTKVSFPHLAAVLAVTPNLKHLTLSFDAAQSLAAYEYELDGTHASRRTLPLGTLSHASGKLRGITILSGMPGMRYRYNRNFNLNWVSSLHLEKMESVMRLEVSLKAFRDAKPRSNRLALPPKLRYLRLHDCTLQVLPFLEILFQARSEYYPCLQEVETVWGKDLGTPIVAPPGMDAPPTPEQWCLAAQRQGEKVGVNTRWIFGGVEKQLGVPESLRGT